MVEKSILKLCVSLPTKISIIANFCIRIIDAILSLVENTINRPTKKVR